MVGPRPAPAACRGGARRRRGRLPLAALVAPLVLTLGPLVAERVPARLAPRARVGQHACHLLGLDGQAVTAVGTRVQHGLYEGLLSRPHPAEKWGLGPPAPPPAARPR